MSCLVLFSAPAAAATIIEYSATDLADVVVGEDLWQYDYSVSGIAFLQHQGFDIFFDETRYADLDGTSPDPDWDVLVIQPDPILPDAGIYSAIANVTNPTLAVLFSVRFVWSGAGTPGSQPFEINQYDPAHDVIVQFLEDGRTQSGLVPEPAALLLLGCGLAACVRRQRRKA